MAQTVDHVTARAMARVGQTLAGKWRLERLVGLGGMAAVYEATHRNGNRVAIKMLHLELSLDADLKRRFLREGYAANKVGHPGVVRVLDDESADDGAVFLVMDLLEGETLDARWERNGRRLEVGEVLGAVDQVLSILAAAHAKGIVHRDVKPENVILARNGGKLADFGIARIPDSTLTHQGGLMGTPAYSAPETFKTGTFSPASDQFSLAAAIYEALSGARAFPGDDAVAVASRIATEPPQRFAERIGLSVIVDEVLERALDRDPLARFPTSAQFGEELAAAIAVGSPKIEAAAQAPRQERKLGQVALGGAVVLLTAGLLWRAALHAPPSAASVPPEPSGEPVAPVAAPVLSSPSLPTRPRPPRPRPRTDLSAAPSTSAPTLSEPPRPSASTPLPLPPPAPSGSP